MSDETIFLTGIGLTAAACLLVIGYLRSPLRTILVDLCGTAHRANFWTAFSHVTLLFVPLIFALHFRPELDSGDSVVFELGHQLKWAFIGVVTSVVMLGVVLGAFIPRRPPEGFPLERKGTL